MATSQASNGASPAGVGGSRISDTLNPLFRKGILSATTNKLVARNVRRYGMRLGAARFVTTHWNVPSRISLMVRRTIERLDFAEPSGK